MKPLSFSMYVSRAAHRTFTLNNVLCLYLRKDLHYHYTEGVRVLGPATN